MGYPGRLLGTARAPRGGGQGKMGWVWGSPSGEHLSQGAWQQGGQILHRNPFVSIYSPISRIFSSVPRVMKMTSQLL